ncbi:hypothetical protein [Haladaptatus halobius]|uniref:hypothetical protein n=1 Tax=Haladaptatus halobius TaxID=2884875 RepID=UPI001D0A0AEE|nr:hypothetical protein [Haladaptatus halobius]
MSDSEVVDAVASEFVDPAPEYDPVPRWWDGEELDHERITEQLEALADNGVSGVCFISKILNGPSGNTSKDFTEDWIHTLGVRSTCKR